MSLPLAHYAAKVVNLHTRHLETGASCNVGKSTYEKCNHDYVVGLLFYSIEGDLSL